MTIRKRDMVGLAFEVTKRIAQYIDDMARRADEDGQPGEAAALRVAASDARTGEWRDGWDPETDDQHDPAPADPRSQAVPLRQAALIFREADAAWTAARDAMWAKPIPWDSKDGDEVARLSRARTAAEKTLHAAAMQSDPEPVPSRPLEREPIQKSPDRWGHTCATAPLLPCTGCDQDRLDAKAVLSAADLVSSGDGDDDNQCYDESTAIPEDAIRACHFYPTGGAVCYCGRRTRKLEAP